MQITNNKDNNRILN